MDFSAFPDVAPASAVPDRVQPRLLPRSAETEPLTTRVLAVVLATVLAAAYLSFVLQFWAPAHNGVDQNGYLFGGKMLARTGSTGFTPADPLGFVGGMWVRNDATGVNYPKYPVGLPLLYAMCFWITPAHATVVAHLISPISAALVVLGTYLLARQFAGVFASLLGMLLMAFSQVTLVLADNPNSHASCAAFVIWGVFLLLRFWQTASWWRGLLAGFLIGYAATIRYTEGLLGLLIGLAILSMAHWRMWRDWRTLLRLATPVLGWLIPIGYLLTFNLVAMHTPTGYDTTNESVPGAAFTFDHIAMNWEKLIRQVHDTGLFFTLPLGILGMAVLWRNDWRRAAILWLWLVPGTLTYMAYYWAPERGVAYLRFFLTLIPPVIVGASIALDELRGTYVTRGRRILSPIALGGVVAVATSISLYRGLFGLEDGQETAQGLEGQFRQQVNEAALDRVVLANAPPGSVVFGSASGAAGIMNDLQFAGDYACFNTEYFTSNFVTRLQRTDVSTDPNDPDPQQPARRKYLLSLLTDKDGSAKTDEALGDMQTKIITDSLAGGKRVFVVINRLQAAMFTRRYERRTSDLEARVVATYDDLPRLRPPITDGTDPRSRQGGPGGGQGPGGPGGGGQGFGGQGGFGPAGAPGGGRRGGGGFGGGFGRRNGAAGGPFGGGGALFGRDIQPQSWQIIEIVRKPQPPAAKP